MSRPHKYGSRLRADGFDLPVRPYSPEAEPFELLYGGAKAAWPVLDPTGEQDTRSFPYLRTLHGQVAWLG